MIIAKNFCALRNSQTSRRQVAQLPVDLPVVEHAAEFFDRAVEEGLLLRPTSVAARKREQLLPVRIAGEQVGIPPDVARLDRLALGLRQAAAARAAPTGKSAW